MAATLRDLNFTSTQADPDVWIRGAKTYYEMVLVYVDDILVFSKQPKAIMDDLDKFYELKPGSVKEPEIYLGANFEKMQLPDGHVEWGMSSKSYVKNAVKVIKG